jgi:hypothetical protein
MFEPSPYRRYAVGLALVVGLAGCAGSSTGANPPTAAVPAAQLPEIPARRAGLFGSPARHPKSWMKPGLANQKLLYVSDEAAGVVNVYTYPGLTFAGQLTGFSVPTGECTDRAGNVWIADQNQKAVYEYAHGGTSPINTLTDTMINPVGCALNLKNGDLAVANGINTVLIFHNAAGAPTTYASQQFSTTEFLGYDNHGNLFVDGNDNANAFHYAELPAGGSTFTDITLSTTPSQPGNVQWDGTYMAVGDAASSNIYRTQGSNIVGTVTVSATCQGQFYITPSDKNIVVPDGCNADADTYVYPAGGSPIKIVTGGLQHPGGAVISR